MEVITSTSNNRIKEIKKLRMKKYRDKFKEFIIEGEHLLVEALKYNRVKLIITTNTNYFNDCCEIIYVSNNVIKYLSNLNCPPEYLGICSIIEDEISLKDNIVVLDGLQDPGNVGTIIRSALAFNINNFILSQDCVDIYNSKVIQASQGAIFQVNIRYSDLVENLPTLKAEGYYLIGTSLENGKVLKKDISIANKLVFIFGNEGKGIKKSILDIVDESYYIKINNIESLNVSCAAAIIFYQFL